MNKCPRCGKNPIDHICEMGMCELKIIKEVIDFEFNIYWQDLDEETKQRLWNAAIDEGFDIPQIVLDSKEILAVAFKDIQ